MTSERVLEHADDVSLVVLAWERDRKLKRLDTRVRNVTSTSARSVTGVWRKT